MPRSWEEIRGIIEQRRSADTALKQQMIEIRDRYNGDYIVPLPSVDGSPELDPPVPRLIADGIDGMALSSASVRPVITVPAIDPAKETGVRSREYARTRRRAYYATWHRSQLATLLRRAYRQLTGYGEMALVVVPDFKTDHARIELRDALTSYPEQRTAADVRQPENVGFIFGRSGQWVANRFPQAAELVGKLGVEHMDTIWDLVEWIDEDIVSIGLLGPRTPPWRIDTAVREGEYSVELKRWPNRAGMAPVACTRRVTLDRVAGQVSNIVGMTDLHARLMALDVLAAEKAIYPDRFVMGQDGRPPQLLSGKWHDGRSGKTNLLTDAVQIGELQSSPGPLTHPVLDRLESAARQSGGVHPFFSGLQPGTNLRTGRAIDSFQAASVNPRIQEMQELMAQALSYINEGIANVEKGYWASKSYTVFSGWPSDMGHVEYTPKTHYESTDNVVSYDYPGTDAAGAAVTTAQLIGAGMLSRYTAMTRHPFVEDPEGENKRIIEEQLDNAVLASVQQGATSGAMPVIDLARIKQLVQEGQPIDEAVMTADEEARERQASEAPPPAEGQVTSPEAQAGLAQPGTGAEQPEGQIAPPPQDLQDLRQTLVALRRS